MRFRMQRQKNRMKENMEIRAGPLWVLFLCTNIIRRKEDLNDERIYYVTKQQYVLQNCDD